MLSIQSSIQSMRENKLAEGMLESKIKAGDSIIAEMDGEDASPNNKRFASKGKISYKY